MQMISHRRLVNLLDYNPRTGAFVRIVRMGRFRAGSVVGHLDKDGYIYITVDGVKYLAHRLAWFYVHSRWPRRLLDHQNLDAADNRIANLRPATHSTNKANRKAPANNTSGYKGVSLNKASGKFQASICRDYKQIHLGFFATAQQAHAAYQSAAQRLFGDFARGN